MAKHTDFILSSITTILEEVAVAYTSVGHDIETHPLQEYTMHSVFLKMTGFQEQKLKCIGWELATNDYEYRYSDFEVNGKYGYSLYKGKNEIYKHLIKQIKKRLNDFEVNSIIKHKQLRKEIIDNLKRTLLNSGIHVWDEQTFNEYINYKLLPINQFADKDVLFQTDLIDKYKLLYKHRNRMAHNTQSYQENLPTLTKLAEPNHKYDNYFVHFALLTLIDTIFVELYKKYLEVMENNYA